MKTFVASGAAGFQTVVKSPVPKAQLSSPLGKLATAGSEVAKTIRSFARSGPFVDIFPIILPASYG